MKYLLAHWRGWQPFTQTFLFNGVIPVALLLVLQHTLLEPLTLNFEWLRAPLLIAMAAVYLAIIITGVVSVNRKHRISQAQTYGAGYSVMACNTGYFLAACLVVVNLADIPTTGVATQTTIQHAFVPVEIISDKNNNTRAYLNGTINPFTPERLQTFFASNRQIKTLTLTSEGGHVLAARTISTMILQLKLNTHVEQHCYSSCTLIYISGAKRTAGENARLGFHRYQYSAGKTLYEEVQVQQEKDAAIFSGQGVKDQFISRIFDTSPDDLWLPSIAELESGGVVTR